MKIIQILVAMYPGNWRHVICSVVKEELSELPSLLVLEHLLLHQIYLSNIQTLVSGGTVSNQGTFNNVSDVVKGLGIPSLDAEESFNIAAGITYKLTDNFDVSLDYYNITLDNQSPLFR